MTRPPGSEPFRIRTAGAAVFLPALLYEIGIGAVLPVIALTSRDLGASLATAALVVALLGVGQIVGDVPAGALAQRVGDRRAMLISAAVSVGALIVCALATTIWVLAAGVLVVGASGAVYLLARQSYLIEVSPALHRARAMSTLAGMQRIGYFVGPFIGAGVMQLTGLRGAYWFAVAMAMAAALVVLSVREPESVRRRAGAPRPTATLRTLVHDHRQVLTTLGIGVVMVGAVRGSRQTVLPLWTEHLGFSPATTSVVFGVSGAIDMLLFYPAGQVMDRRGRLWIGVPSMLVLGISLILLPVTQTLAGVVAVAIIMGLGNGMGSGILMTLGADVAPPGARAKFLGLWRLVGDAGYAGGPLVVSAVAALGSLAAGILTMGAVALLAAGALGRWVPRWSEHANGTTRRLAAERRAREQREQEQRGYPEVDPPEPGPTPGQPAEE